MIARVGLGRYLLTPAMLVLACTALYLWVQSRELDSIEARSLNADTLVSATWRHVELTVVSTVVVLAVAVPLGIALTRERARRLRAPVLAIASIGQALPTIGVLSLLAVAFLFLGFPAAVTGLVIYAVLPVLRNTMIGLGQVDPALLEAARGMGMSRRGALWRVELPLAIPVILAGVRIALVINVGTATLAAYINAGGLGTIIVAGLSTNRLSVQVTGAVLTAVLALTVDYLAGIAEDVLRPRGLVPSRVDAGQR